MNLKNVVSLVSSFASSDYKTSFMLDSTHIDKFLNYCNQTMTVLQPNSKYQVGHFELNGYKLMIFRSGIIIFEDNDPIRTLILHFIEDHQLEIEELESYKSPNSGDVKESTQGWDETPKGVWLTSQQIKILREHLDKTFEVSPGQKHEICRYVNNGQILVLNNNGVVYTIGGFEGIMTLLESAIRSSKPYQDFQRVVIIDERGRWERIGPVCIVVVDITSEDLIQLQLEGLKDDSITRSTDHVENMPLIDEHATWYKLFIEPKEINDQVKLKSEYTQWLNNRIMTFLNSLKLDLNEATYTILEQNVLELLQLENANMVIKNERKYPALGVSSTVSNAHIQKWADDWYKFLGFTPERHHIETIRSHKQVNELAKEFLL